MANDWSDDELAGAVDAYQQMAQLELAHKPYNKREIYRALSARFDRTPGAFDYRMQNISAVLDELGEYWIPGLKPAGNVGANVKPRLIALIQRPKKQPRKPVSEAGYKAKLGAMRQWLIEIARNRTKVTYGDMMGAFGVDRFSLRHAMDYLGHQADNLEEPIITALIVSKGSQRCSAGLGKEFGVHDDEAERTRLYEYWIRPEADRFDEPPASNESLETKAARFVSVQARPEQAAFRYRVFLACAGRCVVTGCEVGRALDAAHKKGRDWRLGHNNAHDGLLLRKDLHALYDAGDLTITDDGYISLSATAAQHYGQYSGLKVRQPN